MFIAFILFLCLDLGTVKRLPSSCLINPCSVHIEASVVVLYMWDGFPVTGSDGSAKTDLLLFSTRGFSRDRFNLFG